MAFVLNNVNLEQFCDELKVLTKYTYILAVIDDFLPNCVLAEGDFNKEDSRTAPDFIANIYPFHTLIRGGIFVINRNVSLLSELLGGLLLELH